MPTAPPPHPPCHQGIMLLGWSSFRPGGRWGGTGDEALPWHQPRAGSGLLHLDVAEDPAHTPDVCRHRRPHGHSEAHRRWGCLRGQHQPHVRRRPGCSHQSRWSLSHLPHLKSGPLTPGGPPWGCQSQVCVGNRGPLSLRYRQAETGHITRMLKAGCWLWPGASASLPVDMTLMVAKGYRPHGVAQLCSPASGSSKVVACLHRLNVRDQGPRQEDAKYLQQ